MNCRFKDYVSRSKFRYLCKSVDEIYSIKPLILIMLHTSANYSKIIT